MVDDHEVLRSGLRWLLTRVGWVAGCAVAASSEQALELATSEAFDVALVDVDLGAECGLAVAERLESVPIVGLLASRWDLVSPRTARGAGARGVIAKDRPARALLGGGARARGRRRLRAPPCAPGEIRFVPREREILRLVGAGLTNAEIGAALFLAPGTIKHHMLGLYEKLGAPNRAAAVHAARRLGVLADHRVEEPVTRRTGRCAAAGAGGRSRRPAPHRPAARAARRRRRARRDRRAGAWPPGYGRRSRWPATRRSAARCGRRASARRCWCATTRWTRASPAWSASGGRPSAWRRPWRAPARRRRRASTPDLVSPREHDVLSALATGATNPAIARALGLSTNTVKQHASSIFRKLGARNRAEAVRARGRPRPDLRGLPVVRADRELDRPRAAERPDCVRERVGELVHAELGQVEHGVAPLVVTRVGLDADLAAVLGHVLGRLDRLGARVEAGRGDAAGAEAGVVGAVVEDVRRAVDVQRCLR